MITDIATLIKTKRKEKGITQKELADGICVQAVISKIEKGETTPSVDIFFKIVKKLEIDMSIVSKIFKLNNTIHQNLVYSDKVKQLLYMRDYENLAYVLKTLNKLDMTPEEILYYEWLISVTNYMTRQSTFLETIQELKGILSESKDNYFQLYLKVVSAIASIYSDNHDDDLALQYFESIIDDYQASEDFQDQVTFLYSISRAYFIKEDLNKSLMYISKAIDEILEEKSIYLLGDSLLMKAYILNEAKLYDESKKYCRNAITIFELENKELLKNMAQKLLIDIEEKKR
ncbi:MULTISPECIES: helix-turn-helix domain-containing protein [Streptococcus]|uniref:helix-turn-helix domain-containing protein n=1 Tax=Streptococcus TaxID=1301 RepID=UPI00085BF9C6|nr:helix-turn-helix domain-containing protein [Streptococcus agalactiae]MDK6299100.1 helix-turn-helix domain-containing protein [Streptococcus agalactiae]MEE3767473.1 helix-turn-helix domain-containing protein [Streptococcus agalactiae]